MLCLHRNLVCMPCHAEQAGFLSSDDAHCKTKPEKPPQEPHALCRTRDRTLINLRAVDLHGLHVPLDDTPPFFDRSSGTASNLRAGYTQL